MSGERASRTASARFGVLVPARNESLVLERKLRNLARLAWPAVEQPHVVVVVDDASDDGTGALAEQLLDEARRACPEVDWRLARGPGRGKARAIRAGVALLGDVDLVVLTDADVILREGSLIAFDEAFREDPGLTLASGAQEFVRDLAGDGSTHAADGGPPQPVGELYDRITAKVRAWESRSGRVFSVHGQLLAWRAALGLAPTQGLAADDLDLMLAARASGGRVKLVHAARFLEEKPRCGGPRASQRQRRAQAYFQVLRAWAARRPLRRGWPDRAQWAFYRVAPALAPYALVAFALLLHGLGFVFGGWVGLAFVFSLGLVASATRHGREIVRLAIVIDAARRAEPAPAGSSFDRWEPPR